MRDDEFYKPIPMILNIVVQRDIFVEELCKLRSNLHYSECFASQHCGFLDDRVPNDVVKRVTEKSIFHDEIPGGQLVDAEYVQCSLRCLVI
ncbi:unnamed protein product [Haemonchus placei]|uniref:DUF772 domain-containing protein n=1 Tax=Haemonchus placei TaxID=6290 RepID=A0A0N4W784_HAEPC|nr:unnamed protein product [Haemonchus placei]